jgi:virginiamycin B lyase
MTMNGNLSKLSGAMLAGAFLMSATLAEATPKIGSAKEFATASANADPEGIAVGKGGLVWYVEQEANNVAVALANGSIQIEYPITTAQAGATSIAQGSDLAFWFAESNVGQIGRVDIFGNVTEYPIGSSGNVPLEITLGSDGNMWFTELVGGLIGTIDTTGTVTEYAPPTSNSFPVGICNGPDGNLWFTEQGPNSVGDYNIGQVTTAGVFTEYDIGANPGVFITGGPDGNIWFTELGTGNVAKFDIVKHTVTEYATPSGGGLDGIVPGADGNLWFVESDAGNVARITPKGKITEYALPTAGSNPVAIAPASSFIESAEPYVFVAEAGSSQIARVYVSDVDSKKGEK